MGAGFSTGGTGFTTGAFNSTIVAWIISGSGGGGGGAGLYNALNANNAKSVKWNANANKNGFENFWLDIEAVNHLI